MADETTHTAGPWKFERMESAVEFAALKGEELAEHEGFYRDNNGDWIVTYKSDDDEGGRIAAVTFKGKAKRGETWRAPDPVGMANARLIAAAPDLAEALEAVEWSASVDMEDGGYEPGCPTCGAAKRYDHIPGCKLHAALAKTRGQS